MKLSYNKVARIPKAERNGCGGGCFLFIAFWTVIIIVIMLCFPKKANAQGSAGYLFVADTTNFIATKSYIKVAADSIVYDSVMVPAILFQSIGKDKDLLICETIWLKTSNTLNRYSVNGEIYDYWETFNKLIFIDIDGCEIKEERIFMYKYKRYWQTPNE